MQFLNSWLQGIIIAVIIATIIEMILPNATTKKYVKVVLGIYILFNVISPVINKFTSSDFNISSLINIDKYEKNLETYQVDSKNVEKINEDSIKQIYISNLQKDIKEKLKEKGYIVNDMEVKIEDDDTYKIKDIFLSIEKEENTQNENKTNITKVNEIVIQIGKEDKENKKTTLTDKEKQEIKTYLNSIYETNDKQITIY